MNKTRASNYVVVLHAATVDGQPRCRCELWYRPYTGWMVACTRWVASTGVAKRDARKWLSVPDGAIWEWRDR
jgi:hypothetical protein